MSISVIRSKEKTLFDPLRTALLKRKRIRSHFSRNTFNESNSRFILIRKRNVGRFFFYIFQENFRKTPALKRRLYFNM